MRPRAVPRRRPQRREAGADRRHDQRRRPAPQAPGRGPDPRRPQYSEGDRPQPASARNEHLAEGRHAARQRKDALMAGPQEARLRSALDGAQQGPGGRRPAGVARRVRAAVRRRRRPSTSAAPNIQHQFGDQTGPAAAACVPRGRLEGGRPGDADARRRRGAAGRRSDGDAQLRGRARQLRRPVDRAEQAHADRRGPARPRTCRPGSSTTPTRRRTTRRTPTASAGPRPPRTTWTRSSRARPRR